MMSRGTLTEEGSMTDDMDAALAGALRKFYGEMLVARTMRTERTQEHWKDAAVKRAVERIKTLYRDGPPENTSPYQRVTRHLGLLNGEGVREPGTAPPELRVVGRDDVTATTL